MTACPYRKEHEFDADGLCVHCFKSIEEPIPRDVTMLQVGPMARLYCSEEGCEAPGQFFPIGVHQWAVRCPEHQ